MKKYLVVLIMLGNSSTRTIEGPEAVVIAVASVGGAAAAFGAMWCWLKARYSVTTKPVLSQFDDSDEDDDKCDCFPSSKDDTEMLLLQNKEGERV